MLDTPALFPVSVNWPFAASQETDRIASSEFVKAEKPRFWSR